MAKKKSEISDFLISMFSGISVLGVDGLLDLKEGDKPTPEQLKRYKQTKKKLRKEWDASVDLLKERMGK